MVERSRGKLRGKENCRLKTFNNQGKIWGGKKKKGGGLYW